MDTTRRWWFLLGVPIVAVLAVVVGSVTERYTAFGDQARIELHSRRVLTADSPLTGLVGRFDWNHPGPAMFWLLSPATVFARHSSTPLRIEYALLCGIAIVVALVLAWGLGRRFFTVIVLTTALALLGLPGAVLARYWNPSFPVALVPLLIVLTAGVAAGRSRHIIGVALVGTVMVQTHVGTALIVAVCAASALGWVLVDARRIGSPPARWRSTLAWAAGVMALLWALPLLAVVRNVSGNLRFVARFFLDPRGASLGLSRASSIVAASFAWRPVWLGGPTRYAGAGFAGLAENAATSSVLWLLVPIATLTTGFLVARRRDDRLWCRYILLSALLVVASIVAISRGDGAYAYTFEWRTFIAPLSIVLPAVPIIAARIAARPRLLRVVAACVAAAVVAASFAAATHLHRDAKPDSVVEGYVQRLAVALEHEPVAGHTIAMRSDPLDLYGPLFFDTMVNEIERHGGRVTVPHSRSFMSIYGDSRAGRPGDADVVWYAVRTPARAAELSSVPGARVVWPLEASFGIVAVPSSAPQGSLTIELPPRRRAGR